MNKFNILVLNIGSSSIKYSVFNKERFLFKGIIERIKNKKGYIDGLKRIMGILDKKGIRVGAIGHRVVHGGDIRKSSIINNKVLSKIKRFAEFAPLHNIPEIIGIETCKRLFPKIKQIAVFDTAFHSTIPQKAAIYGLPYRYYRSGIRRYGFHGISHEYICIEAEKILEKRLKLISCHLGNGSSIAAIDRGKVIDTSMGFTPLEGLVMGTRCGDIDPGILLYLIKKLKPKEVEDILTNKSGLLGIGGFSDIRDIIKNKKFLALDVFCYRIAKYIGAYIAALNGADAIVFTAGIGENEPVIRKNVLAHFRYLGISLDEKKNKKNDLMISSDKSKIKVLVIKTNEELMIAKEVLSII